MVAITLDCLYIDLLIFSIWVSASCLLDFDDPDLVDLVDLESSVLSFFLCFFFLSFFSLGQSRFRWPQSPQWWHFTPRALLSVVLLVLVLLFTPVFHPVECWVKELCS